MLFGENAIRRPQTVVRKTMPHGPKKPWRVARGSWLAKPCLIDLLRISSTVRYGPPYQDGPYAGPGRGIFYERRVSRSVVVSLNLSPRSRI